jgi:predicted nucleic acid-binding protein
MMVVDASVWVGWLLSRDAHHASCRSWLEQQALAGTELAIPSVAAVEIAGAVARRVRAAPLGRVACARVLSFPRLRIYDLPFGRAMAAVDLADATHMRGADLIYVQLAAELNVALITLDREQAERGAAVVATHFLGEEDR